MSRKLAYGLVVAALAVAPMVVMWTSVSRGHRIYRYTIRYDEFPPDDRALVDWLRTQKGVASVEARHDATSLDLTIHTYQRYPSPDVFAACDRFGYRGPGGAEASVERPVW